MRIVQIDTGLGWRGGQSQVLMLLNGLKRYDCSTLLVAKKGSVLRERARQQRVDTEEVPFCFEADVLSAVLLSRLAGDSSDTILHAHTPHALGHAILASRLGAGWPVIFTRRVSFPIRKCFVNRWKLDQATQIIAVSSSVAAQIEKAGIHERKIRIIYDGVDTEQFCYKGPSMDKPLAVAVILAPEKAKGIDDAVAFAAKASHLPILFHFFGAGPDRNEIAGKRNNIVLHGFIEDVPSFFSKMFAAITFSKSEGFPNTVLQAMAVGLPVLAFENPAVREMIPDERFGFVFPSPEIATGILADLIEDTDHAVRIGRCASQRAASLFSSEIMVERTYQLYKEIIP